MAYQMMNPILESQNAGGQDQNYVLVLVLLLLAVTAGTAVWLALRLSLIHIYNCRRI